MVLTRVSVVELDNEVLPLRDLALAGSFLFFISEWRAPHDDLNHNASLVHYLGTLLTAINLLHDLLYTLIGALVEWGGYLRRLFDSKSAKRYQSVGEGLTEVEGAVDRDETNELVVVHKEDVLELIQTGDLSEEATSL